MGRIYTVEGGQEIAASETKTMVVISCPSDAITQLRSIQVGQSVHETAEMYDIEILRASADGTGGATPTPVPKESGDAAFGGTVRTGPAVEPTYTADEPLFKTAWNSVLGLSKVWREGEMPMLSPSGAGNTILGIRMTFKADMTTTTPQVLAEFEELGG